jgi:hypothetical protein
VNFKSIDGKYCTESVFKIGIVLSKAVLYCNRS